MLPLSLSHLSTNSLTYDFDAKYSGYSIKRFTIPNPMSSKRLDCVQFGLDKHIGVPVRLTAECVWTVADGHKVLFEGGQLQNDPTSQEVTVQIAVSLYFTLVDRARTDLICGELQWPGYAPAYPKVSIPYRCTRQEFARLICTEILVWGAVSSVSHLSISHVLSIFRISLNLLCRHLL